MGSPGFDLNRGFQILVYLRYTLSSAVAIQDLGTVHLLRMDNNLSYVPYVKGMVLWLLTMKFTCCLTAQRWKSTEKNAKLEDSCS